MLRFLRLRRPSPAMVVACIGLSLAVGGASAVAGSLITGRDVKDGSLTGRDINNGSLRGADVKRNALTGRQIAESRLGPVPKAKNARSLGGIPASGYGLAGVPLVAQGANGVGNQGGCASGELGIVVRDGRGEPVDTRFSFQVPGPTPAYGQIRSDGSIRNSSANVTSVSHTADTGTYCIHFSVSIGQAELESAVAAPHEN